MKYSKRCLDLIRSFEGYHRALPSGDCRAYPDPGSSDGRPYTIGWGTTRYRGAGLARYGRAGVLLTDVLTRDEAENEFQLAVELVSAKVNALNPNLSQNQHDAAVSFMFNAGVNTKQSDRLASGDLKGFEAALPLYNKGGDGKVLAGLVRRRAEELALWRGGNVVKVGWLALTRRNDKNILSAMDGDTVRFEHEWTTTAQLVSLLRQYPDAGTTVVTKEDWTAPNEGIIEQPAKDTSVATLVKTSTKLPNNLTQLLLRIGDESIPCVSGQGYAQNFRRPSDPRSVPGNMEPIPQGRYVIGKEEWAGTPGDWSKSFGAGLGPWWVGLSATFSDDRGGFGAHSDYGPSGSAGCLVFQTKDNAERFLAALRKYKPRYLDVQWGL